MLPVLGSKGVLFVALGVQMSTRGGRFGYLSSILNIIIYYVCTLSCIHVGTVYMSTNYEYNNLVL